VTEVIAACPYYSKANGVGDYSFTKALMVELKGFGRAGKPFTTGELHGRIYGRVAGRWPEDGSERHENGVERHPAPIFLQLTREKSHSRSIVLSRQAKAGEDCAVNLGTLKTSMPSRCLSTQKLQDQHCFSTTPLLELANTHNELLKPVQDTSPDPRVLPVDYVPRIAISIRLNENFQVGSLSTAYFRDWLLDMPTFAEEVKVEAGFNSFSTLLIVSIPLSLYDYLPPNPAIISLGPITSSNILTPGEHHSGLSALNEIRNKKDASHQDESIVGVPGPTSLGVSLPSLDPQDFHLKPAIHAVALSSDPAPNILQIALPRSIEGKSKTLDSGIFGTASISNRQRSDSAYSNESADYGSLTLSVTIGEYENGRKYHSVSSDPRFWAYLFFLPRTV
jgi:hypothetical protein